jgi:translation initiation factor 2 beta subunit (eIF-2beta)/eIF-5
LDVLNKYRLELRWQDVEYSRDDIAVLKGAYFCGPVFKDAAELQEEDQLVLDMTAQHEIFIPDYYQGTLRWKGVEYKEGCVLLKEALIESKYVNSIETLRKNDWILIDCKGHDTKDMQPRRGKRVAHNLYEMKYNHLLVYYAEVRKEDGEEKF